MPNIKCGHCHEYHQSTAEVRECSGVTTDRYHGPQSPESRGIVQDHRQPSPVAHVVLEGRYAVEIDGVLKFFKVDKPTEGRWAGYTFVKVQASDDLYNIRDRAYRERILAIIAEDPQGAMLRYGKEIGKCGHCGRTLTNEDSRERGIGPICADKMGW